MQKSSQELQASALTTLRIGVLADRNYDAVSCSLPNYISKTTELVAKKYHFCHIVCYTGEGRRVSVSPVSYLSPVLLIAVDCLLNSERLGL